MIEALPGLRVLRTYRRAWLASDVVAGVSVAAALSEITKADLRNLDRYEQGRSQPGAETLDRVTRRGYGLEVSRPDMAPMSCALPATSSQPEPA